MATRIVRKVTLRGTIRATRRVRTKTYLIRSGLLKRSGERDWKVVGPVSRDC